MNEQSSNTGDDLIAAYKAAFEKQQAAACPNCGYCPHCGRSAAPSYPVYPWYSRPWYTPTITTGIVTSGGAGGVQTIGYCDANTGTITNPNVPMTFTSTQGNS